MSKKELAEYQADPERYQLLKSGAIFDNQANRIVDMFSELNPHSFTKENAREMVGRWNERRRLQKIRTEIAGKIDGVRKFIAYKKLSITIPSPDELTDEELIQAEGDADRFIAGMFAFAWLMEADKIGGEKGGGNFRGLTEGVREVKGGSLKEPDQQRTVLNVQNIEFGRAVGELAYFLRSAHVVEGTLIDDDETP